MEMITKMSKPIFLAVGSVLFVALGVILGQSASSIVNAHGGDPNIRHFCVNTDNGLIRYFPDGIQCLQNTPSEIARTV